MFDSAGHRDRFEDHGITPTSRQTSTTLTTDTGLRGKKVGSRKELESLVGLMQHTSKVVRPGRIFLRRLYNLLAVTHQYKPHYLIRINRDAQADIEWWWCFLVGWNGVSLLRSIKTSHPDVQIWSDASASYCITFGSIFYYI